MSVVDTRMNSKGRKVRIVKIKKNSINGSMIESEQQKPPMPQSGEYKIPRKNDANHSFLKQNSLSSIQ